MMYLRAATVLATVSGGAIRLPDAFYRTIASYKLTYYESAVPIGREGRARLCLVGKLFETCGSPF